MARPLKRKVDYFPHFVNSGKTLFILESKYGNDGYSFWFKLLELVSDAGNHVIDAGNKNTMIFIAAKMRVSEEKCYEIFDLLAALEAIDRDLWNDKIIWIQNLVDNLSNLYRNRVSDIPKKPEKIVSDAGNRVSDAGNHVIDSGNRVSDSGNPQSRVEERIILLPENQHIIENQLSGLDIKQTLSPSLPKEEGIKPTKAKIEIPEFEALWKLNPKNKHSSEIKQASKKQYILASKKFSHDKIFAACSLYWKTARKEKEMNNQEFDPQFLKGMASLLNLKNGILEGWIEKVREKEAKGQKALTITPPNTQITQPIGSPFEEKEKRIPTQGVHQNISTEAKIKAIHQILQNAGDYGKDRVTV